MSGKFKKGDKVEWQTAQGTTTGTVKDELREPVDIKGHQVAASQDNPQYLVESDKTGKLATHKPGALKTSTRK